MNEQKDRKRATSPSESRNTKNIERPIEWSFFLSVVCALRAPAQSFERNLAGWLGRKSPKMVCPSLINFDDVKVQTRGIFVPALFLPRETPLQNWNGGGGCVCCTSFPHRQLPLRISTLFHARQTKTESPSFTPPSTTQQFHHWCNTLPFHYRNHHD